MNNVIQSIKALINENQLDVAIQELMNYAKTYHLEETIYEEIWSQQSLQDLILNESKGEFMHWSNTYEMVSTVETLNAPWFYRDQAGSFHNIKEQHLSETLQKLLTLL